MIESAQIEFTEKLKELCRKYNVDFLTYGGYNENCYIGGLITKDEKGLKKDFIFQVLESAARTLQFVRETIRTMMDGIEKKHLTKP